jgi:hypothetical protein
MRSERGPTSRCSRRAARAHPDESKWRPRRSRLSGRTLGSTYSKPAMSGFKDVDAPVTRLSHLMWVGPLAVLASTVAVVIVQWLAFTLLSPSSKVAPVDPSQRQIDLLRRSSEPAIFTVVLVSAAVLVFVAICREAVNPFRTFRRVALVALFVSFVPDVVAAFWSLFGWPLATVYMAMHVAAWAACVTTLTRLMPVNRSDQGP